MILIKNIDYLEVDRDPYEIISQQMPYEAVEAISNGEQVVVPVSQVIELIRGVRFVRPDGSEIRIGMSQQARDVIGIQYDAYDNMNNEMSSIIKEMSALKSKIRNTKLWTRIKWLFTGVELN